MSKTTAPFGAWDSPIDATLVTAGARGLSELRLDSAPPPGDETVWWCEVRPDEGGRGVVCSQTAGGDVVSWTPEGFSARAKVHEYGGGSFCVGGGRVFFTNAQDQRLYAQDSPSGAPVALTPAGSGCRYADGDVGKGRLFVVEEDHSLVGGDVQYPANRLVSVSATPPPKGQEPEKPEAVASGADFYASPRLSPCGQRLTWLQWSFPRMPWEGTEVWVADVDETGKVSGGRKVAGDGVRSYVMPRLASADRLLVVHDASDWWNLYEIDVKSGEELRAVHPAAAETGEPCWQFGYQGFCAEAGGNRVALYSAGALHLTTRDGSQPARKLETGYTGHRHVHLSSGGCVYALATHPARPTAVLRYRLEGDVAETVRRASDSSPDAAFLSEPKEVRFPTGPEGAAHAYANYYPPKSPTHQAPEGTLPPLVVMAHGGPTGQASTGLDLKKQFYTSRGFAVLDVNYRGSTGYGRKYRDALMGEFGVVDIDDCCQAARYAAQQGWADGSKLCIEGGSSGGYVVLCAALRPDLFAAAVSRYGISDMEELAKTTHKFEAPYNDSLIGPYPAKAELYRQRSPINHTDNICCPVAFFQGLDDAVVPPAQTTKMFAAVKAKGLPTALVEFQGEGHGFRKAENIRLALEGSFVFLCKVLRIPTKLSVPRDRMAILNLDERA